MGLDVQIKTATLKPSDLISVLPFQGIFRTACGTNSIRRGAAIRLFSHYTKKLDKSALQNPEIAEDKEDHKLERKLTTFYKMLTYFLRKYATDYILPKQKPNF